MTQRELGRRSTSIGTAERPPDTGEGWRLEEVKKPEFVGLAEKKLNLDDLEKR
jgi:hypothetical protein